jgi:hypothetical protein
MAACNTTGSWRNHGARAHMRRVMIAALAALGMAASPVYAAVTAVDPDAAIDADLMKSAPSAAPSATPAAPATSAASTAPATAAAPASAGNGTPTDQAMPAPGDARSDTFKQDDLIGAAEGVFGKGAQGLATMIEDLLKKQGEPNGYIVGREGSGALVVGLRYGSGTLHHKVEGERPVYWTGPSVGFDVGANAANAFVLVYNLYDTEDLFKRYGAGEGQAYFIGGFHVSYLRRGNVVLIPVRMGAGLRLGANIGYMKFSHKQKWVPF